MQRAVAECRTTYHKLNKDFRELGAADSNCRKKWLGHLQRMSDNRIRNLLFQYKQKGRKMLEVPDKTSRITDVFAALPSA
jgi:ribosomal protein L34